jgi:soluble lytic murein transglycosylase-like protein
MRVLNVIAWLALVASANAGAIASARDEGPGGAKTGWEDLRADLERQVSLEVEAARRTVEAEEHYRRGVLFLQQSRRSEALDQFRQTEAIVLDAGEEAYMASSLRSYLHELRSRIAGLATPADLPEPHTEQARSPESLVDHATLDWLAAAVKRPVPEESALRNIFRSEGVPEEFIYVGLIESGYRRDAVSSAGAAGPWQFIDETGHRYGLGRGKNGDDRRDLLKSTRAAARYLRDLYDLLGDWTLALAGYNAGEYRVLRAMQKADTKDFWSLRSLLPKETADYVPRVLAAISIAKKTNLCHAVRRLGDPPNEATESQIE